MESSKARSIFLHRDVLASFVVVLAVYFVPPLVTGGQLLFDSLAAPVYSLAISTGAQMGCGSLSCLPLIMLIFVGYTYLLSVVLAAVSREALATIR